MPARPSRRDHTSTPWLPVSFWRKLSQPAVGLSDVNTRAPRWCVSADFDRLRRCGASATPAGAILIIGKRRISITAGIWGTPVRHNNTEPSVHVCAALLGRCGSNFEFSKPLAASPASPNPPTAAARRVRSCTTSRAPRGLLLPPTTRHYATVDNAGLCSPTSHPELPCRARSWPAR